MYPGRRARRRARLAVAVGAALLLQTVAIAPLGATSDSGTESQETVNRRGKGGNKTDLCLTLLHNNDAESALINAGSGELADFGGVARFASLHDAWVGAADEGKPRRTERCGIKKYRKKGRNAALTVSSGDNFLPGPVFDASISNGVPFYDALAMELIGYDAVAIGNHDFDFGPDTLADFIKSFSDGTPFLSSNLDFSGEKALRKLEKKGRIAGSVVVKKQRRQIGIIGATTPMLPFVSSPGKVEVDPEVARAINKEAKKLTRDGVKIIILISHLQSIDEDLALAPQLKKIDVMVAGGGDEILANPDDLLIPGDTAADIDGDGNPDGYPVFATDKTGKSVPVVTTGGGYRYLGHLKMAFNRKGVLTHIDDGSGVARVAGGSHPDAVPDDPIVKAQVTDPVSAHVEDLKATVVATTEVALDGKRSSVRTKETNQGNLIADALLESANDAAQAEGDPLADVALQNGGGIRNDSVIGPGDITAFDTFSMLPFSNFLSIVREISPAEFKALLENAVSRVENTDGRFAQISGFSFTYDASKQARTYDAEGNVLTEGERVQEVTLDDGTPIVTNGVVVAAAPDVNVATVNFLARGGDQYPFGDNPFITYGLTYQQALVHFLTDVLGGTVTAADYPEAGEGRITRQN